MITTTFTKVTKITKNEGTIRLLVFLVIFVTFVNFVMPVRAQQVSFESAVAGLKNPDARERLRAVQLLRDSALPEAIPAVAPLVADVEDRVQLAAIDAEARLFQAEGRPDATIVDLFADAPYSVFARPVPPELTAALLRAIADENKQVRLGGAYLLGTVGRAPLAAADAVALTAGLQHPDPATRAAVARACGRLQVREAGDALVAAMNDRDRDTQLAAIWAVGELRFERAVQALTDFSAHYGGSEIGLATRSSLARIAHPSSARFFRAGLAAGDVETRRLAVEGLARLRDRAALPQLQQGIATERDPRAQAALLFALVALGERQPESLAMLLADRRAFPIARDYLRELGPSVVPGLVPQLQHADPSVRRGVVDVLGMLGGDGMANTIWTLQQDPDVAVRDAAARALERLNPTNRQPHRSPSSE